MGVKNLFGVMLAIFAVFVFSYIYIGLIIESPEPPKAAVYIVEEPQMKTFVIGEHQTSAWFEKAGSERHNLNVRRYERENKDELEEFEMKSRYKRVVRSADGDTIFGYLKEVDNPGFEKVDSR
ncbi:MAG: hypothetical protein AABX34_04840 [Nanoarchaeota archaeon]